MRGKWVKEGENGTTNVQKCVFDSRGIAGNIVSLGQEVKLDIEIDPLLLSKPDEEVAHRRDEFEEAKVGDSLLEIARFDAGYVQNFEDDVQKDVAAEVNGVQEGNLLR